MVGRGHRARRAYDRGMTSPPPHRLSAERLSTAEWSAAGVSAVEARVLDLLDERALVDDLVALVRVPSVTGTSEESDLQHRQAVELASYGYAVDLWTFDLPALTADADFPGLEVERSEGLGMVAVSSEDGVPALALQGHVDVVPTGDLDRWQDGDPFGATITGTTTRGGILHGRGACDMKAGVAANAAVARTLSRSGIVLERSFAVHTVISEEDGGLGAFGTLRRGHTAEAAVISEPTSGRLVTANAGALTFRIAVTGRAAHGSTRLEGVSALDAFWPVHLGLAELERARNAQPHPSFAKHPLPYPISVGKISAGDWASSVPDLLVAEGRLGVQLGEDPATARSAFEAALERICAADPWLHDHPAHVTWPGGQFASGWIEHEHPLIGEVGSAVATVTGGPVPSQGAAPYGSDLRLYTGLGGIPTLHYGPGDVRFAHAPREQVSITETLEVARSLLLLTLRRCGAHF